MINKLPPDTWFTPKGAGSTVIVGSNPAASSSSGSSGSSSSGGTSGTSGTGTGVSTSAADAHKMIWSIGIGIFVVVMAIILAGINDNWGNAMVAIMLLFLAIQLIAHIDVFTAFIASTEYLPVKT